MSIDEIRILNIMCFQRQWMDNRKEENDCINIKFDKGINVFIGKSGTGKTAILKLLYSALEQTNFSDDLEVYRHLSEYFINDVMDNQILKNYRYAHDEFSAYYKVLADKSCFSHTLYLEDGIFNTDHWYDLNIPTIYIPANEVLSNSKIYFSITYEKDVPFDASQSDTIIKASFSYCENISVKTKELLDKISKSIGGTVIFHDDTFYILRANGIEMPFALESKGIRKLGLLWKLLQNGLLEPGSVLLWDEPEAHQHIEMIPVIADILLDLQDNGVQIFITTNSYYLVKYLDIHRNNVNQVMFHHLYKKRVKSKITDQSELAIFNQSSLYLDEIENNELLITYNMLR